MINFTVTNKHPLLLIVYTAVLLNLIGCESPQSYQEQADEAVYAIIDQKWENSFGTPVNYKISDTAPLENDLEIEKTIPPSGILTLPRAVAIATAYNRQYQTEKEILYKKALDLRLARHQFDPLYFGLAGADYSKDGINESVETFGGIGFERLTASGTQIMTDLTVAWIEILTGNSRSGLSSLMSAAVSVPLLRGSDSRIVLEELTQAERDTVYQIRSFNRYRQMLAVSIISQYYRVLEQYDRVQNTQVNYQTLQDVHDRAQKLADAGRLPLYELNEAKQDMLKARDMYIQAQKDYQQSLDDLKISLSLPPATEFRLDETELDGLSITDLDSVRMQAETIPAPDERVVFLPEELELIALLELEDEDNGFSISPKVNHPLKLISELSDRTEFPESEVIETALALRLDLANQADRVEDAERKINVAADNLRAELNLTAATQISSEGSSDSAAGLGLNLDLPLERMAEANEYRKALIDLTQEKRVYEQAVDLVSLQVRQVHRDYVEAAQRHAVQQESMELAQKRFMNTFLLLQYDLANTRDVLDAQEDLFDARNAVTGAMVDHIIAMLEFYRDTGVLQVRPDGMWEH